MSLDSLREVYLEDLKDIYSAEQQLTKALPKMAKAASTPQLKKAFEQHLAVTQEHVKRIEQICTKMGEKPTGKKCKGMEGLIEEGKEVIEEKDNPYATDAALIVAAQKVEHYEIAAYSSVRTFARLLGETQAARLLERTLNEEKRTDDLLSQLAERNINAAAAAAEEEQEEEEMAARGRKSSGRGKSYPRSLSSRASNSRSAKSSSPSRSSASKSKSSSRSSDSKRGGSRSASSSSSGSRSSKSASNGRGKNSGHSSRSGNGRSSGNGNGSLSGNVTTDHEAIRQWVEERGGHPACVRGTGTKGDTGLLRIDYPGYSGQETLEEISWDEFFEKFDEEKLAFLHQDQTAEGKQSRFSKLIGRNNAK